MSVNFFGPRSVAERYAKGRPNFHPAVLERVKNFLAPGRLLPRALDVGCGTGLSSTALKVIADEVVGVDASPQMLALAPRDARVLYAAARAEELPLFEGAFDLMTLSQSFHWLDRGLFLKEARRVLAPGGWLVAYDNYFSGRMEEDAEFEAWYRASYPKRFPAPARAKLDFTEEEAQDAGFLLLGHERFENTIRFSLQGLVEFLLTHSNVIAAVEYGTEDMDEITRWLLEGAAPFYAGKDQAGFIFNGVIWYLKSVSGYGLRVSG